MRELGTLFSVLNLALGMRGKRHRRASSFLTGGSHPFLNTSTLLGAAGLAVAGYEVFRTRQAAKAAPPPVQPGTSELRDTGVGAAGLGAAGLGAAGAGSAGAGSAGASTTGASRGANPRGAPVSSTTEVVPEIPEAMLRLVRLSISAARADGELSAADRERCLAEARAGGVEAVMRAELEIVRPLSEIVRGVTDPGVKRDLYTLAYSVVRADEQINGSERIYLAQLAAQLGLEPAAVEAIERETDARIDAQ